MPVALLLLQTELMPWDKMFTGGISFVILVILLVVLLRLAPTWKEVKLREIDSRDKDSEARVAQSKALEKVATVLYEVAVEQRRSTDTVKILQHVNSRDLGDYEEQMATFDQRLAEIEKETRRPTLTKIEGGNAAQAMA